MSRGFGRRDLWTDMTTTEVSAPAAQPDPNMKNATNAMPRRSRLRKTKTSGLQKAAAKQNAQKSYEHYLALAHAEALNGDPIAAENYLQHAEHYLRSMHQPSAGHSGDRS